MQRGVTLLMNKSLFPVAACSLLAACGTSGTPDSQIVAKGNGFEITVSELDQLLRSAPAVTRDQVLPMRRAILAQLIDQKLLAQAAVDRKIDRQPEPMQLIEAAKRGILAQAYIDGIVSSVAEPTDREVADFYAANPRLFADRRIIQIDQVAVTGDPAILRAAGKAFDQGGLAGLTAYLASAGRDAAPSMMDVPTTDLPVATADRLARLGKGAQLAFQAGGALHLGVIAAIRGGALALEDSRPEIVARIKFQRRAASAKAEADRLRREHDIKIIEPSLRGRGDLP